MPRKSYESRVYELLDKHPRMSVSAIAKKYGMSYNTIWKYKNIRDAKEPLLTITPNDVRMGVIAGFFLGVFVTITAKFAGVL